MCIFLRGSMCAVGMGCGLDEYFGEQGLPVGIQEVISSVLFPLICIQIVNRICKKPRGVALRFPGLGSQGSV